MPAWTMCFVRGCFVVSLVMAPSVIALAQAEDDAEKSELAELVAAARKYDILVGDKRQPATLREPALLNFSNPERNQERGTVLVWMLGERPVAVGQFFRLNARNGERTTKHAFHSLWSDPLTASIEDSVAWSPKSPGVTWKDADNTPPPADAPGVRLLQMRQLARQFHLTLTSPNGDETELRLIPRPLLEYAAPDEWVLSGAMFSFVVATDPEALLLIEAVQDNGVRRYRFAFARFHFRQLTASIGENQVWRVDYDPAMMNNQPGDPSTVERVYSSFVP